jgi:hypothetical protein
VHMRLDLLVCQKTTIVANETTARVRKQAPAVVDKLEEIVEVPAPYTCSECFDFGPSI